MHPTPHALHARSCATLIMRVALQIPSGSSTAEVPTRRWTPGLERERRLKSPSSLQKKKLWISPQRTPGNANFLILFEYLIPYSY